MIPDGLLKRTASFLLGTNSRTTQPATGTKTGPTSTFFGTDIWAATPCTGSKLLTGVRKPATPERKGINPFTKEETVFKAKPARNVVKLVPLSGLKELV